MITSPEAGLQCPGLGIIMLSSQWRSIACSIWTPLAPLAWSVVRSASQLATYLLKCIHKLNWGNSTHNNSRNSPLWPATGPVIECLPVTDGFNHHCIIVSGLACPLHPALHHRTWPHHCIPSPVSVSRSQRRPWLLTSARAPRALRLMLIIGCDGRGHDKITQKLRANSVYTLRYVSHICFESS